MKSLVLVGAGHAHIALIARARTLRAAGFEVVLVDPGSFWYGGAPGALMAGRLGAEELRLPLREYCRHAGICYYPDRAVGFDTRHRRLWLAGSGPMSFDTVSLNVGHDISVGPFDDNASGVRVWRSSSMYELSQCVAALGERAGTATSRRVAVIGGGARAAEIVAGLVANPIAASLAISWFVPGAALVPGAPTGVNRRLLRYLSARGVDCMLQTRIDRVGHRAVCAGDGPRFPVDHVLLTQGVQAAGFVHSGGLPAHDEGLYVTRRLQSPADQRIYASGGCASILGAEGATPIDDQQLSLTLAENIAAGARRRPFRSCRLTKKRAGVVDLGNGKAIGWWGRLSVAGTRLARRRAKTDGAWLALIAAHHAGRGSRR